MTDLLTKSIRIKAATDTGEVSADIATLNVKDHDGDVTLPGAFGKQYPVIVGAHEWDQIMVGAGAITDEDGEKARFKGQLNLDDPDGAKLHSKIMFDLAYAKENNRDPKIEWSYGYDVAAGGIKQGEFEGGDAQFFQPLEDGSASIEVFEVSPVLKGAGIGTGTTGVKSRKFVDHIESAAKELERVLDRAEEIAALRAEDGKTISDDAQRLLADLAKTLPGLTARAEGLLVADEDDSDIWDALEMAQAQYESIRQLGV